ncbi:hypothetical protein [Segnochrobactrum spirostomi]|uniref:Uncharacterized protein n=1 Tax=Segnochrobactrum spirostomi TaxID=2608987 RepID=A0A6A7Y357_9HYPH|nr:hypothetical protein [Segnochrobactrum spirostomi]MQT13493.1 hypothetical protein [Segnochrobactrum spirostomi]
MTVDTTLVLNVLKEIRAEQASQRALALQTVDYLRRVEKRLDDRLVALDGRFGTLRDDLELMVKAELMGRLSHFETRVEQRLDAMAEQIALHEAARP